MRFDLLPEFFQLLGQLLLAAAPRWIAAWLISLVLLVQAFHSLKPRLRRHAVAVDERMQTWARSSRFEIHEGSPSSPRDSSGVLEARERIWLTWFFRFWTNLASAPALALFSLALPFWMWSETARAATGSTPPAASSYSGIWVLPGLAYMGGMFLSYITKRVFRRLRPERPQGTFGHRLKDPSFPSGHSLTALCFWGMSAWTLALTGTNTRAVAIFAAIAILVVALTGLSRVYMGVHFASDVAGGYLIGMVWSTIFYFAVKGLW